MRRYRGRVYDPYTDSYIFLDDSGPAIHANQIEQAELDKVAVELGTYDWEPIARDLAEAFVRRLVE